MSIKRSRINGSDRRLADRGTPELQARRRYFAGLGLDDPVGILVAHAAIGEDELSAARRYAWLHAVIIRRRHVQGSGLGRVVHGGTRWADAGELDLKDENLRPGLEREFWAMLAALDQLGRRTRLAVDALVIHARMPRWMQPTPPTKADVDAAKTVLAGLKALAHMAGYAPPPRHLKGNGHAR